MQTEFSSEIVERMPQLRRYALRLTGNASDADDLVQDCIERALNRCDQFQEGTNLEAWLMTIMRSVFINAKRHEKVVNDHARNTKLTTDQSTRPSQLHRVELKQTAQTCRKLSDEHREAIYLLGVQQHTHKEAARAMGTSTATAKTRLFRARSHLKELLAA